jgi:hypothetical protein
MAGAMIVLDVAGVAMLGVVLWRLLVDRVREQRLLAAVGDLRTLIAEAEREARVVDERLSAHVEQLRGLLRSPAAPRAPRGQDDRARARAETPRTQTSADDHQARARRVRELAARATPVEEIARRVDLPLAEIRLLVGLQQGRRPAPAPGKKDAARTAA